MQLQHIGIDNLKVSDLNVRKSGDKSGDDLVPSIKAMGIVQPLLVRPNCEGYEVVAGQRRLAALQQIATQQSVDPVPCLVMGEGDDAKAIEASLAENIARLPMDAVDQFEAFHALTKQGQTVEEIAQHFGVTERLVTQRLAIAALYEPIRNAFRREDIGLQTMQILTMASTRQQKEWYRLFKSDDGYAPQGWQLKSWLFGGVQIPTENALFDLDDYKGVIVSDLFGEDAYFADPELFWEHQNKAIAALAEHYAGDGWAEVIVLDVGERFPSWEHIDTTQENGGKVFIQITRDGEATPFEGQLSRKEARKRQKAEETGETKPVKCEVTKAMQNYLALHRHAVVRTKLLDHPKVALRLCVAQIIAGSGRWDVTADPQRADSKGIAASLEGNAAQQVFSNAKAKVIELLDIGHDTDSPVVYHMPHYGRGLDVHALFAKLMELNDKAVMQILTFIVAETLDCGSAMVEGLGAMLGVDMADSWKPDETFFDLMRDKEAINAMLKEKGGKSVADGNVTATAKAQKQIIRDFLQGENGREHKPNWQPRYMGFPMKAYTNRGGVRAIDQYRAVKKHYAA
ncbi:MAG: ParB/RepB/Spo0J family partition protein [Pseudomonadota bacterium]